MGEGKTGPRMGWEPNAPESRAVAAAAAAQHSAAQHSTAQHSTAQAQHSSDSRTPHRRKGLHSTYQSHLLCCVVYRSDWNKIYIKTPTQISYPQRHTRTGGQGPLFARSLQKVYLWDPIRNGERVKTRREKGKYRNITTIQDKTIGSKLNHNRFETAPQQVMK